MTAADHDDIARALLPPGATPLERALLATELDALSRIDSGHLSTLWNPETCPIDLLPWLAWALSVDLWDDGWPEEIKRSVVAAAPAVHRLKGTRKAVEIALAAFGVSTRIVEWWEEDGRRGTFSVTAYVGTKRPDAQSIVDDAVTRDIQASISASKPKARAFKLTIAAGLTNGAQLAHAAAALAIDRRTVKAEPETDLASDALAASAMAAVTIDRRTFAAAA